MGATVLAGLGSPVTFPKQTASGTASWVGENPGSDVSDTDLDTTTVALAPKTLTSSTSYSRQLLAQASFDVEALVRADLAKIHALAIDKAAIHGLGSSNEPTGIYAASGVNSKAMGGAVAFGELVDMATEVALDNALLGSTGFVTNPGMAGKLMQVLEASSAGARMIWTGTHAEGQVAGYRAMSTNQVSKVMSGSTPTGGSEYGIVFGNWADLYIGTWGALEVIVDPYRLKKQGMVEVTSFQLADILLRHGESFCKATGATLA
jgi:HK97 family phage major capsid protein